jgi:hypothetical protein
MANNSILKHTLWLNGVIAGLAIKEAYQVIAEVLRGSLPSLAISSLIFSRFFIFLLLIIRSYLGTAIFFDLTGDERGPSQTEAVTDSLFGLSQFSFFYFMASNILLTNKSFQMFLFWLTAVLLSDVLWYFSRLTRSVTLRKFMVLNLFTYLSITVLYVILRILHVNAIFAEIALAVPIIVISLLDIIDLSAGLNLMEHLVGRIMNRWHSLTSSARNYKETKGKNQDGITKTVQVPLDADECPKQNPTPAGRHRKGGT